MEDTKTSSTSSSCSCRVANYDVHCPSHFLKEAVNAILKCLGFESKPCHDHHHGDGDTNKSSSSSSSKEQDKIKNKNNKFIKESSCSHDDDQESSSYATPADPPSTTITTTRDPPMEADLARRGNTPPRPVISGGRDPQTNSNRPS